MTTKFLGWRTDEQGTTEWLRRTAESLDPYQFVRELVQNAYEAGSPEVFIDGWTDPESGKLLLRVSDRGEGMAEKALVEHMRWLRRSGQGRDDNFGIGARVATVGLNPAGVYVASRRGKDESQISMRPEGLEEFGDRGATFHAYQPSEGILDRIGSGSGTVFVMRGNGRQHTFTSDVVSKIRDFIQRRYWTTPAKVLVHDGREGGKFGIVMGLGDRLEKSSEAAGEVILDEAGSRAIWYKTRSQSNGARSVYGLYRARSGMGVLVGQELFGYAGWSDSATKSHYVMFGLGMPQVAKRVVLVVEPKFPITMTDDRSDVRRPGNARLPWSAWGEAFRENMPAELQALMDEHMSERAPDFLEDLASRLNPNWQRDLRTSKPGPRLDCNGDDDVTVEDDSNVDKDGLRSSPSRRLPSDGAAAAGVTRQRRQAQPSAHAPKPKKARQTDIVSLPSPEWLDEEDWPEDKPLWVDVTTEKIFLLRGGMPFDRSLQRHAARHPEVRIDIIQKIVEKEYGIQAVASFVDIAGWERLGLDPDAAKPGTQQFEQMILAATAGMCETEQVIEQEIERWQRGLTRAN